tara:strand:+ start:1 stop:2139 length:2139 start_codon:yes stop_codon:yes gene_type:complete
MNTPYQRELFKEWLVRENKNIDINRLFKLDDKVNSELDIDLDEKQNKKYKVSWIMLNNFLSFGEGNFFPVDRFKGFTVVNSIPENQGGKTTLVIDAMKYLLFGKTTKTDTNSQVFNKFSDKDELTVRGMIEIDGEDEIIIERKLKRTPKRKGGFNITNKVNYYRILPDGDEEELNDEDAIKTTKLISETVGTEKDFDLVVLVTSRNLDTLVDSTSGESGKLITRLIGLEVITLKEVVVRKMYSNFTKTMKSNIYDSPTLVEEIEEHEKNIVDLNFQNETLENQIKVKTNEKVELHDQKVKLIESKEKIDSEILSLNPSKINDEIEAITTKGKNFKSNQDKISKEILDIGTINFDEDRDFELNKSKGLLTTKIGVKESEIGRLKSVIKNLISSGICHACNRKLDDVDNSKHIESHEKEIELLIKELEGHNLELTKIQSEIDKLKDSKDKVNLKNQLELKKDRISVELESLRTDLRLKRLDLTKYQENIDGIEKNRDIDSQISIVDTKIRVNEHESGLLNKELQMVAIDLNSNNKDIISKGKIIKSIEQEDEINKVFKVYIEMIGKKGISKLVLRSVLPIINGELQRLLEDITDFDVEIFIDDKNEVRYLLIKDEVEAPLKSGSGFELTISSIALRCVLGKVSSLPTPNFIAFDEVLGGRVARNNVPKLKPLFDRVSDMFDKVFFITQSDLVKEWSDNVVTVVKEGNISKVKIS